MMPTSVIKTTTGTKRPIAAIACAAFPVLVDDVELKTREAPPDRIRHVDVDQREAILPDGFDSGKIEARYRAAEADCELLASLVPDCDLDPGLGSSIGSSPANVSWVIDDSDGDPTSGALEMVVHPSIGASTTLCFPKTAPRQAYIDGYVDVRVINGSLSACWAESAACLGTDCSGQIAWMQSYFLPVSSFWEPHWLGGFTAGDSTQSLRMTLRCDGDATIRFDEITTTPLDIVVVP